MFAGNVELMTQAPLPTDEFEPSEVWLTTARAPIVTSSPNLAFTLGPLRMTGPPPR